MGVLKARVAGAWVPIGVANHASAVGFTPTGTIAATDVQAAIAEVSGDVTALAAAHRVDARHLTSESFTVTTSAVVPLGAEIYDTDNFHSTTTNNSRLIVPAGLAGVYLVSAHLTLAYGGTIPQHVDIHVRINGAADSSSNIRGLFAAPGSGAGDFTLTGFTVLSAGAYVEMYVGQFGGTAVTTRGNLSSAQMTGLSMVRVAA